MKLPLILSACLIACNGEMRSPALALPHAPASSMHLLPPLPRVNSSASLPAISFGEDSISLSTEEQRTVFLLSKSLKLHNHITVIGSVSPLGNLPHNRKMTVARINAVSYALVEDGLPPNSLETEIWEEPVIIYGSVWCPPCNEAKIFFRTHSISFLEKDVSSSEVLHDEMNVIMDMSGTEHGLIPIIVAGRTVFRGFYDRDVLAAILSDEAQYRKVRLEIQQ
jgi:glutaredoxin